MRHGPNSQRGVALIVALVILVLVTIAGVATMESTGMELKMTNADRDHQQAFEMAETALRLVETKVQQNNGSGTWLDVSNLYSDNITCATCFNPTCDHGGLCFEGVWLSSDNAKTRCSTVDPSASQPVIPPWYDSNLDVWNPSSNSHGIVPLVGYANPVMYIIEFRCFVPKSVYAKFDDTNAAELFRITVRAKSNSGNAEVMLQSTYKVL